VIRRGRATRGGDGAGAPSVSQHTSCTAQATAAPCTCITLRTRPCTKQDPSKTRHDQGHGAGVRHDKGQRRRHVRCHCPGACTACPFCVRVVCTSACAYLSLVSAFVSLFVLADIPCLRAHVLCLRGPFVRACPAPACVCFFCVCACALSCIWSTCSIAVSFLTQ